MFFLEVLPPYDKKIKKKPAKNKSIDNQNQKSFVDQKVFNSIAVTLCFNSGSNSAISFSQNV